MKLSRKWLNEFVDLPLDEYNDKVFAEAMTISGSKVEITEDLGEEMKNVRVGRILSIEKHPNSDHMLVTQIDVGESEPVQICTGAWNVHVGDLVPAALHNSVLPGGMKISRGKLRGVESDGMLCSLKELDATTHDFPYGEIKAAAILGDDEAAAKWFRRVAEEETPTPEDRREAEVGLALVLVDTASSKEPAERHELLTG